MTRKLSRGGFATDVHFGKKGNSAQHNEDCLRYIDWFCDQVKEQNCDYVAFLGDWNENRNAINIATLNYSYQGAKKLNDLGVPVFFCIGNHDLYHRHTRELHSIVPFHEFDNFTIVSEPLICNDIADGVLFSPYMFHDEYPDLAKFLKMPFWAGHFEFKGFRITNYNIIMPTGPDPDTFDGPRHIVSGHFHMRQAKNNIVYMGNAFPMDFGDAGDNDRGMMIYDHIHDKMVFLNWDECPRYVKTTLTDILDKTGTIHPNSRVKCIADVPITFEESTYLRQTFVKEYQLREFIIEESHEINDAMTNTATTSSSPDALDSVDDLVIQMLTDIKSDHIDNNVLIRQYQRLIV
jgi:DNA repair exonuclease SbcCD nuclease subunit